MPAVRLMLRVLASLVFPRDEHQRPLDALSGSSSSEEEDSKNNNHALASEMHHILEQEKRFKFALLSTTILLITLYNFLLLVFLCPGAEFAPAVTFSPRTTAADERSELSHESAPTFRLVIGAFALVNCTTFVLHHLLRSVTFSAWCFFLYTNGSMWVVCLLWGPVSEFLGAIVHVPVLAFYLFGHRAGVGALAITLAQAVVYTGACLTDIVPTSGNTLKMGLMAQMSAIMGSYVLLGLCAALNEWSRTQAVRLYQEAHTQLTQETKAKARFLANVSHELRTPLHGIMAASEQLLDRIEAECADALPATRDMCSIVAESSHHMLALINDVLDLERMETNQMEIERIAIDVDEEFSKVIRMMEPTARQKQIILKHYCNIAHSSRMGDPLRFRQLLFNLASNALKFTPEGGEVSITATTGSHSLPRQQIVDEANSELPQEDSGIYQQGANTVEIGHEKLQGKVEESMQHDEDLVTVIVRDSGIGIPEGYLPLIFKSFSQADSSTTRKFGGSGLGLAICKRLCQLMHGRIGCSSKKDEGATFWFTLPLPLASDRDKPTGAPAPPPPPGQSLMRDTEAHLHGLRTLLVDDHKVNQTIGRQMLMRAGSDVVVAQNGEQGVHIWEEQGPFDIILMDYHMPIMDGLEATRRIRQRETELDLARTPIVALSASSEPKERQRGAAAGMDDWLVKPFSREALSAIILHWVRRQST